MLCMSRPSAATLSRSRITSSTSGWSTLVSMVGGKANMPLVAQICCNCSANFRISSGSAVEDRTRLTGKFSPPVGNGEGVIM